MSKLAFLLVLVLVELIVWRMERCELKSLVFELKKYLVVITVRFLTFLGGAFWFSTGIGGVDGRG